MVSFDFTLDQAKQYVIDDCNDNIQRARERRKRRLTQLRKQAMMLAKLAMALPSQFKLKVDSYWDFEEPRLNVQREDLLTLRKALGRLHKSGMELESAEDRTVRVYLAADEYPGLLISYVRPLAEGASCQIVETVHPAWTSKSLACSVS